MQYKIENGGIQLNFVPYKKGDVIELDEKFAKELQDKDKNLKLKAIESKPAK